MLEGHQKLEYVAGIQPLNSSECIFLVCARTHTHARIKTCNRRVAVLCLPHCTLYLRHATDTFRLVIRG